MLRQYHELADPNFYQFLPLRNLIIASKNQFQTEHVKKFIQEVLERYQGKVISQFPEDPNDVIGYLICMIREENTKEMELELSNELLSLPLQEMVGIMMKIV